jgi:hypothetical protein
MAARLSAAIGFLEGEGGHHECCMGVPFMLLS